MRVTYFHRSLRCGISIRKVFNTIIDEVQKTNEVQQYFIPAHYAGIRSVLKNILYVFKHRDKNGVNHITGDVHYCMLALIGCKSVLTIHDLSALDFERNPIKKIIIKILWFKLPLLIANKVVCISEHTQKELMKISHRKDIEVIFNAIDSSFKKMPKLFNKQKPNILQIGTAWNKNILNTIKAISSINCHLVIIGSVNNIILNLLSQNKISYTVKTDLTDNELIQEYYSCDIVSYCSLYEGFGMPIIEANAIGRCVITSNLAPMNEVAESAAWFINPNNITSIKEGFSKIITEKKIRNSLINNGFINIRRFEVKDISCQYVNVYNNL